MKKLVIVMALTLTPLMAHAGAEGHGGDIECENVIRTYYFPTIQHWIINGGPENAGGAKNKRLDLSSTHYPETGQSYTLEQYKEGMEKVIPVDQSGLIDISRLHVNCVSPGDSGWPVDVNDFSKTCSSRLNNGNFYLKCKASKFVAIDQVKNVDTLYSHVSASDRPLNADEAIEQIHHEPATWVPGLEPDSDDISTYEISKQLSDHIQFIEVPTLVVGSSEVRRPDDKKIVWTVFYKSNICSQSKGELKREVFQRCMDAYAGNEKDCKRDGSYASYAALKMERGRAYCGSIDHIMSTFPTAHW